MEGKGREGKCVHGGGGCVFAGGRSVGRLPTGPSDDLSLPRMNYNSIHSSVPLFIAVYLVHHSSSLILTTFFNIYFILYLSISFICPA